jgi:hypothetical protein
MAKSESMMQDWYNLNSNRQAAAFEYKTDCFRTSGQHMLANAISYRFIAYKYFFALKNVFACYLNSSDVLLGVV